jgi:ribosomal protein S12 methylthiotransferase
MHCKPPSVVMAEARELIGDGALELNLIGQDTTSYGEDIDYAPGLAGLLRELNTLDGARWIRLLYVYPSVFTDEMIDAIAECDKLVKYIDIPLQHINDRMLKAMHRRVTRGQTETLLRKIRDRIPGVEIRTTFISGFPGESESEFEELLDFVRNFGFSAVGVFPYSLEPDTPSGRMKEQLAPELKQARADAIMEVQQSVAFERAAGRKGEFLEVLLDQRVADGQYAARHAGQAPEVDSVTYVLAKQERRDPSPKQPGNVLPPGDIRPGQFVRVLVEGSQEYDFIARPTNAILPVLSG